MVMSAASAPVPEKFSVPAPFPLTREDCAVLAYHLGLARHHLTMELAGIEKLVRMLERSGTQHRRLNLAREALLKARADIDRCDRFPPQLTALQAWIDAHPEVAHG
jgi:hypothetical protein